MKKNWFQKIKKGSYKKEKKIFILISIFLICIGVVGLIAGFSLKKSTNHNKNIPPNNAGTNINLNTSVKDIKFGLSELFFDYVWGYTGYPQSIDTNVYILSFISNPNFEKSITYNSKDDSWKVDSSIIKRTPFKKTTTKIPPAVSSLIIYIQNDFSQKPFWASLKKAKYYEEHWK